MKIGWTIRNLWHFEALQIFKQHFLTWPVDINMQMSESMMSSPHNFPFILYTEIKNKKSYIISSMRMLDLPYFLSEQMQNNVKLYKLYEYITNKSVFFLKKSSCLMKMKWNA